MHRNRHTSRLSLLAFLQRVILPATHASMEPATTRFSCFGELATFLAIEWPTELPPCLSIHLEAADVLKLIRKLRFLSFVAGVLFVGAVRLALLIWIAMWHFRWLVRLLGLRPEF